MNSLDNSVEINQRTRAVVEEQEIEMNSQSAADVVSYPYPKRSQPHRVDDQPAEDISDRGGIEDPALPILDSSKQMQPIVVFIYPTRSERLHIEAIRLERQLEDWEDEGGRI